MNQRLLLLLALCLLLTGCGILDGTYHSVSPHRSSNDYTNSFSDTAEDYLQLCNALADMVSLGVDSELITVSNFQEQQLLDSMAMAVNYIKNTHPIGAYAVDEITYEVGNVGSSLGVSVQITYRRGKADIQKIRQAANMEQARELIGQALTRVDSSLVMLVDDFHQEDIALLVADYAAAHLSTVMEKPEVVEQIYPDSGSQRVWELKFVYQTPRDSLMEMQELVARVFDSAALYVNQNDSDFRQFSQLYGFLMARFQTYQLKPSLTPTYSLLNYGVGDCFTLASVYAEMCARAGLECMVVTGTLNGELHYWNIVLQDGYYYHVDLVSCQEEGYYLFKRDIQMTEYVWDYSAYPKCTGTQQIPADDSTEPTEPIEPDVTEPEQPEEPTEPPTEPDQPTEPPVPPTEPTDPTEPEVTEPEPTEDPTEPSTEPDVPPQDPPIPNP